MKFYYRHKTYNELFLIDIERGDKALLQSIIRKFNEFRKIDSEVEENEENIQLKNCFILIYNCYWLDLLDVDLFSLLNNNSSYTIIYDNENYKYYKKINNISKILNADEIDINEPISNISPSKNLNNKEIMSNIEPEEIGKYKIIKQIASHNIISSAFAVIKKDGTDKKLYMLYTPKKDIYKNKNIIKFKNGIDILAELNKGTKCKYIPILYDNNEYYINLENQKEENSNEILPYYVTDFYSRGNLIYYFMEKNNKISEKHIKLLFNKIISCIQFCHNKNICLLDIHPSNFAFDKEFNPIFTNYGFSIKFKNNSDIIKGVIGDKRYRCPEMYEKSEFIGIKADIFSLGVLLFNLVTGKMGFITSKKHDYYYNYIISKDIEAYWKSLRGEVGFGFSREFEDLYIQMVSYNPSERPTLTQILESKWMEEINNLNEKRNEKLEEELKDILNDLNLQIENKHEELMTIRQLGSEYETR